MTNKLIISILVILLVTLGGFGYYSFNLSQQLDRLDEKLTTLETERRARINTINEELSSLRTEIQGNLSILQGKLEETSSEVSTLNDNLTAAETRISGTEDKITGVSSDVKKLAGRVDSAENDLSGSIINASDVFKTVSQVTIRITDGQSVKGSGFIYDAEGYAITAYHVVQALPQIYVIMDDGRVSKANLTGFSHPSDVAVLKLDNGQLTTPPLIGNSSTIKIGEPVVTIGSPGDSNKVLGLKDTLTAGVVSQINRYVNVDGNWVANMIQFDAAVNFGNSGGPLANSSGEIIGLITARIDPTLGDGIYYAVASNKFKRVADAIIANGSFPYPWLGLSVRNISPQEVLEKSLETNNGVIVEDILNDSPAQTAGIKIGDIILLVDSVPVRDVDELVSYLGEFKSPDDTCSLSIIRDTDKLDISVKIGTRE